MASIETVAVLLALGIAAGTWACSSGDAEAIAEPGSSSGDELVLKTTAITLQPSEEKYLCWDLPITGSGEAFAAGGVDMEIAGGIHHYQLTSTEASSTPQAPGYSCGMGEGGGGGMGTGGGPPPGVDLDAGRPPRGAGGGPPPGEGNGIGTVLSVGGPTTPGVHFPEGTALMLRPGTRLTLQLHILNAAPTPKEYGVVTAHVRKASGDPSKLQEVGVLLVNDDALAIPALSRNIPGAADCKSSESLDNVFAIWPHMHLLGTSASVAIADRKVIDVASWNFDDQRLYAMKETMPAGTQLSLRCNYDNPTDKKVSFGMGTNDEMCSAFVYYYPARKSQGCAGSGGAR